MGLLSHRISTPTRRDTRDASASRKGHNEKVTICELRREDSEETNPINLLILDFQLLRTPSLWNRVMGPWEPWSMCVNLHTFSVNGSELLVNS